MPILAKSDTVIPRKGNGICLEVRDLTKVYHGDIKAVDNVSFTVDEGEIYGLLGPNGAGKTTTIKILMTLTKPTSGSVKIYGIDALSSPAGVRQIMGYVPQEVSVDGDLTGYENLLIFSKLYYVKGKDREDRIRDALEYMGLKERTNDLVKHYSGGMMRRLEIAQALVNRPKILFLDEPSIGLDPSARREVGMHIKQLNHEQNTTIFITTHDMMEADELCDKIAILNSGKIVISDSPAELKKTVGGDIISIKLSSPPTQVVLPAEAGTIISSNEESVNIITSDGEKAIPRILDYFEKASQKVVSISLSRPTLDDVFLKYTHGRIEEAQTMRDSRLARKSFRRHAG
jgi:ABC-2 type transport system ATP-binding protein